MVFGFGKSFGQNKYTLINNVSQLEAGAKYIVVNSATSGTAQALGFQNGNNRKEANVVIANVSSVMTISTTVASSNSITDKPFELSLGGVSGAWTLQDIANNNYYLWASGGSSGSNNYLNNRVDSATWSIGFSGNAAVITAVNPIASRNIVRYNPNSGNGLFSCYASGQSAVYLYKLVSGPEINLQGNGNNILSGATTTSLTNNTDFGDQNISSGSVVKTFTIQNTGGAALNLTGTPLVLISGANASDFTVTQIPSTPVAATSGTTTFQITFDPTTVGVKNATVSIANNDSDENPYTFVIQGTGITPTPKMVVKGSGVTIVSGDSTPSVTDGTNFGSTAINTTVTKTFTIENTGTATLVLPSNPILLMVGNVGFTHTEPLSLNIAPSGSTTFTVSFNSATAGLKQDHVMIASNDNNVSSTYEFAISATATDFPANPGGTISGTTPACTSTTLTYTGVIPSGETYYWQTSATGTSTANNATSSLAVLAGGTYFVRAFRGGTWSAGASTGYAIVINSSVAVTTNPINASRVIPATANFSVTATGTALSYQWQVSSDGGNSWASVSNGSGGTTATYTTPATEDAMNGYQYKCIVTNSCNVVTSTSGTLTLTNSQTTNAINANACYGNTTATINWAAASGTPTGYIVFALPSATVPEMAAASAGNAVDYVANSNFSLAPDYSTLGKAVYKGSATSAEITGLTLGVTYTYKIVAYKSETMTGWSPSIATTSNSSSWVLYNTTAKTPEVTALAATVSNRSTSISWTRPTPISCYEYIVVANQGGPVVFAPSGDASTYIANSVYSGPNQIVYKGNGNSAPVTGLTNGSLYCYKVFVRKGTEWSEGSSFCQTPDVVYCNSYGNNTDNYYTGIRRVIFNTIDNSTPAEDNNYSNFLIQSTIVNLGESYALSVYANTDGVATVYAKAWIDWNKNGSFNDSGESYELGTAYDGENVLTTLSGLEINVPTGAFIGDVRMRVAVKYDAYSTSCEQNFDGEVEDYTIHILQPTGAEIYVKGNNQNILSGSTTAYPLNQTLFAGQTIGSSAEKNYLIGNVGLSNLLLTGTPIIKIEGVNPADFSVSQYPASSISSGNTSPFKITFTPTASGTRTAIVSIANNDLSGNENPYTFLIQGTGNCNPTTATITPASGPVGTEVTITASSGNISGGTVMFNGVPAISVIHVSSTEIKTIVPEGATTGNLVVTNAQGCTTTNTFEVIDSVKTVCQTESIVISDLIIYEVLDENGGSGGYISIYNGTGSSKNLSGYSLFRGDNYSTTAAGYGNYASLSGTLAPGAIAVVKVSSTNKCSVPSTSNGTINSGFNGNDGFQLRNGATVIDDVATPNYVGYYMKRKLSGLIARTTYDSSDWHTNTVGTNDCFGDGTPPVLIGNEPTITLQPIFTDKCGTTSLTIEATEGFNGGNALTYQWFFTAPGAATWSEIIDGGVYSGATTANLSVTSLAGLENYQFYAQVRENTNTCFTATNAVSVVASLGTVTWDGVAWVGGFPDKTKDVIINGIYSTVAGNFEARSLVNNGDITITDGGYIKIEYGLANNGPFKIKNNGSLVQVCDDALNTGIEIKVERIAKPMYRYDYTYWSSPVSPQTVGDLSPATLADKYFKWDTNFQDWTNILRSQEMAQGIGYIIRAPQTFSTNPLAPDEFTGNFEGAPNNGIVTASVEGSTAAQKWNLLGNPYPSAISADKFLDINQNPDLEGTIYVWTHNTPLDPVPNAEGFYSYAPNDYAVYNGIGGTATAPGAAIFEGYIASGQGFFVKGTVNGTATFNNEMRLTNHNTQFLRTPASNRNASEKSRIWLDISNAQNAFKQVLIGYVNRATNEIDREFDGEILGSNGLNLYSVISDKALAIQGRALPFDINDKVDLGYKTITAGNLTVSLSNSDGLFTDQNIYLEDKTLNIIHDLKQSDYTFASAIGTFNDRFVLRYTNETLSNPDFDLDNSIKIGVKDKSVTIKSSIENIQEIAVYDLLGRVIYDNKNVGSKEFTINELAASNQALIVKVYLENGTITNKKIVVN